jgi:hypothetical protein
MSRCGSSSSRIFRGIDGNEYAPRTFHELVFPMFVEASTVLRNSSCGYDEQADQLIARQSRHNPASLFLGLFIITKELRDIDRLKDGSGIILDPH